MRNLAACRSDTRRGSLDVSRISGYLVKGWNRLRSQVVEVVGHLFGPLTAHGAAMHVLFPLSQKFV